VRYLPIYILAFFAFSLLSKCENSTRKDKNAEQVALNLINKIDSPSIELLKKYSYGRRGEYDFWQRISTDETLYSCSYKKDNDTVMLTVFRPYNFVKDFPSTFNFDTANYEQYDFFKLNDSIVKILQDSTYGQDHISDTSILVKQLFPGDDPFAKFEALTNIKDELGFIGTFYRSDIGDFFQFWIIPQYKLTYLPDTLKLNPKFKKYWLDEFAKGKKIKENWSLLKVYE